MKGESLNFRQNPDHRMAQEQAGGARVVGEKEKEGRCIGGKG